MYISFCHICAGTAKAAHIVVGSLTMNKVSLALTGALAMLSSASMAAAAPVTVDFNGGSFTGSSYSEKGFNFTPNFLQVLIRNDVFFPAYAGQEVTVTAEDGSLFSLRSLDVNVYNFNPMDIVFTGVKADGSEVTQTFSAVSAFARKELSSAFSGLKSFRFTQGPERESSDDFRFRQFRNREGGGGGGAPARAGWHACGRHGALRRAERPSPACALRLISAGAAAA